MKHWQPSATPELIKLRANTLRKIRAFFDAKDVLEVDTPVLSAATVTDPFIESFQTRYLPLTQTMHTEQYYLHTSPEFAMKRLLASGSGSIYQISKVFRQGESGQRHNPEFTLLEWYRQGWDHHQLMNEIRELLEALLSPYIDLAPACFVTYKDAFETTFGIDPHRASKKALLACAEKLGLGNVLDQDEPRDRFLELLFSHAIEANLGKCTLDNGTDKACICFLYHYPASQAALARTVVAQDYEVAERFEVFIAGMELGNGFHELNDAREQRARLVADNEFRIQAGQTPIPLDENFLAAIDCLPNCAGVAIGIERLLMVMSRSRHINDVITFPFDRA